MAHRLFDGEDLAAIYQRYRPTYPARLHGAVLDYLSVTGLFKTNEVTKLGCAIDIGCGSGQSTHWLTSCFHKVIGCDVSTAQIEAARKSNTYSSVDFIVAQAEAIPVPDGSAQLITVGTALHWLDFDRFYKEVDRVLCPGGVIACFCFEFYPSIVNHGKAAELTAMIREFIDEPLDQGYWHERDQLMLRRYTDKEVQIPYSDTMRVDGIQHQVDTDIDGLFGYFRSRSGFDKFLRLRGEEGRTWWSEHEKKFMDIMGTSNRAEKITYQLNIFLIMGRKPLAASYDTTP